MLKFAMKHMLVRRARVALVMLSIILSASVGLLAYNISQQVNEGIISTAAYYDIIIGPAGSSTQLAMNTMFFTDEPLGTISYEYVEELKNSGLANAVVPFTMGDSYNGAAIVGTTPEFLEGRKVKNGAMFSDIYEAVVGSSVVERYGIAVGDSLVTSHGLTSGGTEHASAPLRVTGILKKTGTAYDNVIFTGFETVWATHGEHHEDHQDEEKAVSTGTGTASSPAAPSHARPETGHADIGEQEEHDETGYADEEHEEEGHDHDHGICAVLVKSKSFNDYYKLTEHYGKNAGLLCINPSTVLREVLEQVDLSTQIVYILCAIILVMNLVVVSVITLLNMYDAQMEIALMRLIGVGMKRIAGLYLIENGIAGFFATMLALLTSRACLVIMSGFVSRMGIVLSAVKIYPLEWLIMLAVFIISVLPTMVRIWSMSRKDGLNG